MDSIRLLENLTEQTASGKEYVTHLAVQAIGELGQRSQRDTLICFCLFQLTHALGRHSGPCPKGR